MSAYIKKIAVIKQIKSGFSADGGAISGLVKAETYAGFLKVEVSLINFAPLSEGRYVLGITDGLKTVIFEGLTFEGESDINLSTGFAFLVCFCHNSVAPIASASCGPMACALPDLKEEMTKRENIRPKSAGAAYDDEAISEVNYYERTSYEGGAAVCAAETQEEKGNTGGEDEAYSRPVQVEENGGVDCAPPAFNSGEKLQGGLAGGDFYSRMKGDIEKIFKTYPKDEGLERVMEGSRFARIAYGEGKYYVFGVLTVEGKPRYICYGVPSHSPQTPPRSLKDCSSFVPVEEGFGYWITYQDAATGVSIKIGVE
ncbi:MAG: hypothetical protein K2O67_02840 [Clostridia bacterium]|nr:hypothetical protein [Clostridia bacterium]